MLARLLSVSPNTDVVSLASSKSDGYYRSAFSLNGYRLLLTWISSDISILGTAEEGLGGRLFISAS